jgi:SAM-dependent methyltransferase
VGYSWRSAPTSDLRGPRMDEPDNHRPLDDPLAGSAWSQPGTVSGFVKSPPNPSLMRVAAGEGAANHGRLLDIGCGAGRNAVPLSELGWQVFGVDLSAAMLTAARSRHENPAAPPAPRWLLAPMDALPFVANSFDFIVAHGIWNLARSGREFRRGVAEAARVSRPGASLFLFTFSRNSLPEADEPVAGESFVFTQFSGAPQCFLSAAEIVGELAAAGFAVDDRLPLHELFGRRSGGRIRRASVGPVIYEGLFRRIAGLESRSRL